MNKSQEQPSVENVSLGLRFIDDEPKKIKSEKQNNTKKNKEIFADPEKKLKINVLGSKGKNLYEKMNQYIDKFKNDVKEVKNGSMIINDSLYTTKTNSNPDSQSKIKNSNTGRNTLTNYSNVSSKEKINKQSEKKQKISTVSNNISSEIKNKNSIVKCVKTELPKQEMISKFDNVKNKIAFDEAQRAAIMMRKLEYFKGKTNIKKIIKNSINNTRKRNNRINLETLRNNLGEAKVVFGPEEVYEYQKQNSNLPTLGTKPYKQKFILRIQIWWRKKYEYIMKLKFLQHYIRKFLLNKKFPKDFQSLINLLFKINSIFKRIEKRRYFIIFMDQTKNMINIISNIILVQRKIKNFLILKKYFKLKKNFLQILTRISIKSATEKYRNKIKKILKIESLVELIFKILRKISIKDEKIKNALFKNNTKGDESLNNFHKINLFEKKIKLDKIVDLETKRVIQDIEMKEKNNSTSSSNKQELIKKRSLEKNDSVSNNSNKSNKIVLKTSSRENLINNEKNKLIQQSSDENFKNDISKNSNAKKFRKIKIKYIIEDDEEVNSKNYKRTCCDCNIY